LRIKPFRGYRHGIGHELDLSKVVAPPYDQISPETQERLYALSPDNIVRVSYPRDAPSAGESADKYCGRNETLDACSPKVCGRARSGRRSTRTRNVPGGRPRVTRAGFVALGEVTDYALGVVLPHERTHAGPKQDRMRHLETTGADIGLIFMLTPIPARALRAATAGAGAPIAEARDLRGELHRLWRITEAEAIRSIEG